MLYGGPKQAFNRSGTNFQLFVSAEKCEDFEKLARLKPGPFL